MKATHTIDTPTVDVAVTPPDVLRGAARYLQLHGWTQNSYYAEATGTYHLPPQATYSPLTPPACALGAIGMAAFGQKFPEAAYQQPEWADYKRAEDTLLGYLGCEYPAEADDDYPEPEIGEWNDQPDRTAEQVITALLTAADEWDRSHAAAAVPA